MLSLFFIDKVANYRIYNDDGTTTLGKIGQWFENAYKKLTAKSMYKASAVKNLATITMVIFPKTTKAATKTPRAIAKMMTALITLSCVTRNAY